MDKDKFVEANGIKIHYVEEGEGPPLLLIHGGGLTAKSWQGLAKEASRYFRVIMPDSRGHGLTNNPQGTFSYDLMAEDMAAFVKALKLEKPLVMGYSDGGMVVLKLTSRYPDLARAAIVGGATHRFATTHYMQGMEIFYGKGMPQAEMPLIPGSGHAIFQTPGKTPLFYALVLEFLQRQIPKTS
ncbi:TPA: alpha/beta hydrolase [Salmonella enterica]|nr:alpha/beta hydrolase [Salmonella enterica]EBF3339792.1 alpha/beta hydrolase [Salmonella enterica subsp. enterica serovar Soerenga]EJE4069061.1 alpha/beta hydrolase [Salmonella enterica subsp. enterica serovar Bovismorbificans]EAR7545907.1 alpha/beta hydrolase [Salmonella enterica]EBT7658861.1 alpha/beta hydrolase [Salmonella enterica]